MSLIASPVPQDLLVDRDQDIGIIVTLPQGTYLTGGASAWGLYFEMTHPTTDAVIISKTSGGGGIVVTTAGSAVIDAVFTITLTDADLLTTLSRSVRYNWKFKRTDNGFEVNIAAGTIKFRR